MSRFAWTCQRCGHSSDWHSFDDAQSYSITDPRGKFHCNGPNFRGCASNCPDCLPREDDTNV